MQTYLQRDVRAAREYAQKFTKTSHRQFAEAYLLHLLDGTTPPEKNSGTSAPMAANIGNMIRWILLGRRGS